MTAFLVMINAVLRYSIEGPLLFRLDSFYRNLTHLLSFQSADKNKYPIEQEFHSLNKSKSPFDYEKYTFLDLL